MEKDEFQKKQEETLRRIRDFSDKRKTEIVEEIEEPVDDVEAPQVEEETYVPLVTHVCEFCGGLAYIGQIHGLGYCKEKIQYEE